MTDNIVRLRGQFVLSCSKGMTTTIQRNLKTKKINARNKKQSSKKQTKNEKNPTKMYLLLSSDWFLQGVVTHSNISGNIQDVTAGGRENCTNTRMEINTAVSTSNVKQGALFCPRIESVIERHQISFQ